MPWNHLYIDCFALDMAFFSIYILFQFPIYVYFVDKIKYALHISGESNHRPGTVGAIDMGGASMQIAVEVTKDINLNIFSEKDKTKVVDVNLGCRASDKSHQYRLFVTTFLGYGANEAIARYHRYLVLSQFEEKYSKSGG